VRRLLRDPTGYSYSLKKDEVVRMACQVKNKSCCDQVEKRNITSRTSLFGIVKNVFKLNHSRSVGNFPSYRTAGKSENSEVLAIRTKVTIAEAQFRRVQMVQ
jgi:hypothetical protein